MYLFLLMCSNGFQPTVLTNLQRGNIKASEHHVVITCTKAAWFENAGRGNIELAQIKRSMFVHMVTIFLSLLKI